jgi:hypothetical protein
MPDEQRLLFNEISLKFVKFHRLWCEMKFQTHTQDQPFLNTVQLNKHASTQTMLAWIISTGKDCNATLCFSHTVYKV